MTHALSPDYQILNNRQWLLDQSFAYMGALLSAAEPLKALWVLEHALPVVVQDDVRLLELKRDLQQRTRHSGDFEAFRAVYLHYSDAHGGPLQDPGMLLLSRVQMTLEAVVKQAPGTVLEIGTGDGTIANALLTSLGSAHLTVADISDATRVVEALNFNHPGRVRFKQTVTDWYDWPQGTFDAVLAMEIIEHVADQVGFLRACAEKLAPGGVLHLTTPEANFWLERNLYSRDRATPFQHLTANTPESLIYSAMQAGLVVKSIRPSTERHIVITFQRAVP